MLDTVSINICIHACRRHWEPALACFDQIRQRRLRPTAVTFGSVVAALGTGHRWIQVVALLQHLPQALGCKQVLMNAALGVFKKAHRWDLALDLCTMQNMAKVLNPVGMTEVVAAFSKSHRWQQALALALQNQKANLQSYNWLLYGFRGGACWQAGLALLVHAAYRSIDANTISHRHVMFLLSCGPWQQSVQQLRTIRECPHWCWQADAETIALALATFEHHHRAIEHQDILVHVVSRVLQLQSKYDASIFRSRVVHDVTMLHEVWIHAALPSVLGLSLCRHFIAAIIAALNRKCPSVRDGIRNPSVQNAHVLPSFVARLLSEASSLRGASRRTPAWWTRAQLAVSPSLVASTMAKRVDASSVSAWIGYRLVLPERCFGELCDELVVEAKLRALGERPT